MKDFKLFARGKGIPTTTLESYGKRLNPRAEFLTPTIVEEHNLNVAVMDVFSRLMMERIVFLGSEVDDTVSNIICAQLLYLDYNSETHEDINLYVNSPGGSVYSGNAILDVMDFVQSDVSTLCTGLAASMGAMILCNGTKGKRKALKRSRVMIHQPSSAMSYGQASDILIEAKEIARVKQELIETLVKNTGNSHRKVIKDIDRDNWMNAKEALVYGMIDIVVSKST